MSRKLTRTRLAAAAVLMAAVAGLSSAATASASPNVRPHDAYDCDETCINVTGNAVAWTGNAYLGAISEGPNDLHGFFSIKGAGVNSTSETKLWHKGESTHFVEGTTSGEVCATFLEGPQPDGSFKYRHSGCVWVS